MGMIEVKNFRKSFGAKVIHNNVNFFVKKGECLGLIGGSGAGKSVILRSLIGLEKPDSGQIIVDNQDITKLSEAEWTPWRKKIAYAFQGGALFDSMTVFENIAYPLQEHLDLSIAEIRKKVLELLKDFGLEGTENLFPANLSGGMQKRVGLARAMALQPEVILYDEPTAGLDPYNTKRIQEIILKLKSEQVTSILVTHDMPTALAVCDKMAFLKDGQIQSQWTIDQLQSDTSNLIHQFMNGEIS